MRYGLFVCAVAFILLSLGVYPAGSETKRPLVISSTAFDDKGFIPRKYTCDGQDINPPLEFDNVPRKTKSLALIVDDPDAPGKTWVHWVLWNIDPSTRQIPENSVPKGAKQGTNDFKKRRYGGPCPPATHTYFFLAIRSRY